MGPKPVFEFVDLTENKYIVLYELIFSSFIQLLLPHVYLIWCNYPTEANLNNKFPPFSRIG